jgi:ornithine carbamoyltransferase
MQGKNVALIFEKTSTRTRCAFEVGAYDQGAGRHLPRPERLAAGPQGVDRRHRAGAVPLLRRHRVPRQAQSNVEELAEHSDVPVWNGLTDEWHPTQMLADFLTMIEHSHKPDP